MSTIRVDIPDEVKQMLEDTADQIGTTSENLISTLINLGADALANDPEIRARAEKLGWDYERMAAMLYPEALQRLYMKAMRQPAQASHPAEADRTRGKRFREWAESHERGTPLLSDEAMSREAIYGARG